MRKGLNIRGIGSDATVQTRSQTVMYVRHESNIPIILRDSGTTLVLHTSQINGKLEFSVDLNLLTLTL